MTRIITIFFIQLLSISVISAQELAKVEVKELDSQFFPFKRTILIYTPDRYDEHTQSEYDVIYVFDSQTRSNFDLVHGLMHYGCQVEGEDVHPFIVVGVTSPYLPEFNYDRNRDFYSMPVNIPKPEAMPDGYGCNPKFKKFIKDELIPYINHTYRTTGHTLAVGHSLSASFIIDAMTTEDMFDDYIAISPNLEWDDSLWGKALMNYDFNTGKPGYIFMSMANECEDTGWSSEWRAAWEKVKTHFDTTTLPDNIKMRIKEYPDYSHDMSYQPALIDGLKGYAGYCLACNHGPASKTLHPVHIELSGENLNGEVYLTGNQEALANWNPAGVKMTRMNDSTYSIDLNLQLPAEFKFTQGSWENQIEVENAIPGNLRITNPLKADKHYRAF